jgi:hypothetical protein
MQVLNCIQLDVYHCKLRNSWKSNRKLLFVFVSTMSSARLGSVKGREVMMTGRGNQPTAYHVIQTAVMEYRRFRL